MISNVRLRGLEVRDLLDIKPVKSYPYDYDYDYTTKKKSRL